MGWDQAWTPLSPSTHWDCYHGGILPLWEKPGPWGHLDHVYDPTGRLDIGVEHVSDCERLAKQCQMLDLLSDLEAKCEKVSEFGECGLGYVTLGFEAGQAQMVSSPCSPLQWLPSLAHV